MITIKYNGHLYIDGYEITMNIYYLTKCTCNKKEQRHCCEAIYLIKKKIFFIFSNLTKA
jgi:hypothetical protein